jgi:hypothetical protein
MSAESSTESTTTIPPIMPIMTAKQKKANMTSYWGVALPNHVYENEVLKKFLSENSQLVPLKNIHSTLLFVGKREDERELVYDGFEGIECTLTIDSFGYSDKALALQVESITYLDDGTETHVPSFPNHGKQHVTLALKEKVLAKDSVKVLLPTDEEGNGGTVVSFEPKLVLTGTVKRYLF